MAEESPYPGPKGPDRRQPARRQIAVAIENRPGPRPGAPHGAPLGPDRTAPRVVASGRGALAEQILQVAFDRGIKVRQDADLAEILATIEIESEIPLEALAAVAEILSYVYRAQSKVGLAGVGSAGVGSAGVGPESGT